MNQFGERKKEKLTLSFTSMANSPLQEFYEFDELDLDISLLESRYQGLKSLKIKGYVDFTGKEVGEYVPLRSGGYSYLVIKTTYEIEIPFGANAIKRLENNESNYPPIPTQDFGKLFSDNLSLCEGVIKYLSWRKGYKLDENYKDRIVKKWKWNIEGFSGNNDIEPHWSFGDLLQEKPDEFCSVTLEDFNDFYRIQTTGRAIPLHHELLAEAYSLLDSDKVRSCYIIMYSSVEVATKDLIKYKKPETLYLIDKLPSPELGKLYKEYINDIIEPSIVSEQELAILLNMTTTRNKIAHTGLEIEKSILQRHYEFVKILIDRIDSAMGYTWTLQMPNDKE